MKPVRTSVIMKPSRDTTNISYPGILKNVENNITAVNSLVPRPAKLIGMKPAALATGKRSKKKG
ncbi:MAG TPA: hypothetical protein ENG62_02120 [Thermoplasmatales archaeon]|nr:hypothetical protein [Thermoplasmatales archaeon]